MDIFKRKKIKFLLFMIKQFLSLYNHYLSKTQENF